MLKLFAKNNSQQNITAYHNTIEFSILHAVFMKDDFCQFTLTQAAKNNNKINSCVHNKFTYISLVSHSETLYQTATLGKGLGT